MSQELEKKETQQLQKAAGIQQMPEFQPIEKDDPIRLPRLALVQGGRNNQIIKEGLAKDGDIINSLSKEVYGSQVEVVPLVQYPNSRIRWRSRSTGGGILCIARDGRTAQGDPGDTLDGNSCLVCPYFQKKKAMDQNDEDWCSVNIQMVALIRETREPILLTGDSIKPADQGIRDILSIARIHGARGERLFSHSYILKAVEVKKNQYEYYKLQAVPGNENKILSQQEYDFMAMQYKFFIGKEVEAQDDTEPGQAQKGDGWD